MRCIWQKQLRLGQSQPPAHRSDHVEELAAGLLSDRSQDAGHDCADHGLVHRVRRVVERWRRGEEDLRLLRESLKRPHHRRRVGSVLCLVSQPVPILGVVGPQHDDDAIHRRHAIRRSGELVRHPVRRAVGAAGRGWCAGAALGGAEPTVARGGLVAVGRALHGCGDVPPVQHRVLRQQQLQLPRPRVLAACRAAGLQAVAASVAGRTAGTDALRDAVAHAALRPECSRSVIEAAP